VVALTTLFDFWSMQRSRSELALAGEVLSPDNPMAANRIIVRDGNEHGSLREALALWRTPALPLWLKSLDARIAISFLAYRESPIGIASPRNQPTTPEVYMKRCNACDEPFEDKFSFCPVDGTPLNELAAAVMGRHERRPEASVLAVAAGLASDNRREFKLTMINSLSLGRRLAIEISFVRRELKRAWPEFKSDPVGFSRHVALAARNQIRRFFGAPNALAGVTVALLIVFTAVLSLVLMGKTTRGYAADKNRDDLDQVAMMDLTNVPAPTGNGVGVNSSGRVGLDHGKGEGSEPRPQRAQGGGGSGDRNPLPAQQGKVQQTSAIPAPINPVLPNAALPVAGIDLDPALNRNLKFSDYGDPRAKSTVASKGSGDGGAIGTGSGLGVGEGDGNGFGPGHKGNIGGGNNTRGNGGIGGADGADPRDVIRTFTTAQVTQRAKVLFKPEPQYTEEARKNDITGSVILRVIFSESGEVTSIRPVKSLPGGLTEKAIAAARQIRFIPATKDGRPVSVYMQLEYNFNLY
jgi:TonB family protein